MRDTMTWTRESAEAQEKQARYTKRLAVAADDEAEPHRLAVVGIGRRRDVSVRLVGLGERVRRRRSSGHVGGGDGHRLVLARGVGGVAAAWCWCGVHVVRLLGVR